MNDKKLVYVNTPKRPGVKSCEDCVNYENCSACNSINPFIEELTWMINVFDRGDLWFEISLLLASRCEEYAHTDTCNEKSL